MPHSDDQHEGVDPVEIEQGEDNGAPPYQLLCLFESMLAMAGQLEENWHDLLDQIEQVKPDQIDSQGRPQPGALNIDIAIDRGGELSVRFASDDATLAESKVLAIFQLSEDGYGPPDPAALCALLEECLEDYQVNANPIDWSQLHQLIDGGTRTIEVRSSWGDLLYGPGAS